MSTSQQIIDAARQAAQQGAGGFPAGAVLSWRAQAVATGNVGTFAEIAAQSWHRLSTFNARAHQSGLFTEVKVDFNGSTLSAEGKLTRPASLNEVGNAFHSAAQYAGFAPGAGTITPVNPAVRGLTDVVGQVAGAFGQATSSLGITGIIAIGLIVYLVTRD